jgi:hypothetical protein
LSGEHCRTVVHPGKVEVVRVCDTQFCDQLCNVLGCEGTDALATVTTLEQAGLRCRTGSFFILDCQNEMPAFGRAVCFASLSQIQWYLVAEAAETVVYDNHTHSYVVVVSEPK